MNDLTDFEIERKQLLEEKLRTRMLTINEANELTQILEKEKKKADSSGNVGKALGILLLLGLVYAFLKEK